MTLKQTMCELLADELRRTGYDGLCCTSFSCGCGVDDLMPGKCDLNRCVPAIHRPATAEEADELDCKEGDLMYFPAEEERDPGTRGDEE